MLSDSSVTYVPGCSATVPPFPAMSSLPYFRYHPDPLSTGAVVSSSDRCSCCSQVRGYLYVGPLYTTSDQEVRLCPWCIAEGTAAERFDATFTDESGVGDYGSWDAVPEERAREISARTPGFHGWQQERWWTHCGDGAAYLGRAGFAELCGPWAAAGPALRADAQLPDGDWESYWQRLSANGAPTAYIFQCLHCGALGGYSDSH